MFFSLWCSNPSLVLSMFGGSFHSHVRRSSSHLQRREMWRENRHTHASIFRQHLFSQQKHFKKGEMTAINNKNPVSKFFTLQKHGLQLTHVSPKLPGQMVCRLCLHGPRGPYESSCSWPLLCWTIAATACYEVFIFCQYVYICIVDYRVIVISAVCLPPCQVLAYPHGFQIF